MARGRLGRTAVAAVCAAGVAAGVAVAQSGDPQVQLCVNKDTAAVRLPDGACKTTERAVVVNQRGPTGAKGSRGPTGPTGTAGLTGRTGARGLAGIRGTSFDVGGQFNAFFEPRFAVMPLGRAGAWSFRGRCLVDATNSNDPKLVFEIDIDGPAAQAYGGAGDGQGRFAARSGAVSEGRTVILRHIIENGQSLKARPHVTAHVIGAAGTVTVDAGLQVQNALDPGNPGLYHCRALGTLTVVS